MKRFIPLCAAVLASLTSYAQKPFQTGNQHWADSVFARLTLDEKIGQLMMPRANFTNQAYDQEKLKGWVRDYKVGGLVWFANQPTRQTAMINELQAISAVPMMMGEDLEWGLTMRLDSAVRYPYALTLGAIRQNDDWFYRMGKQIGEQCRRAGIHINYAPVADVNNNPNNPVIGFRSFGENREEVLRKAKAYMRGMQDAGLITSAKHFPGHGDTDVDSHADLPVINHSRTRLDSLELYPFRELIKHGLNGVMIAHLSIPALDPTPNQASTLSRPIVTDLLRKQMGFEGLIFTDAMEMQGVAKHYPPGVAGVKALLAGNDVLETFTDVPVMFQAIKKALVSGEISQADLDDKVHRILRAKAWLGLDKYQAAPLTNLLQDLNKPTAEALSRRMSEASLTVLKNENGTLPIKNLATAKVAAISVGTPAQGPVKPTAFQSMLMNYLPVDTFQVDIKSSAQQLQAIKDKLAEYDLVVVALHSPFLRSANAWPEANLKLAQSFVGLPNAAYLFFGNPYVLNKLPGIEKSKALVVTYQETTVMQELAAQLVGGGIGANGQLPVTVNQEFKFGNGLRVEPLGRFKYGVPELAGIDSKILNTKLDSIVNQGLQEKAYPGASVVVAKNGMVIFKKAYGTQTYESKQPVRETDLYDLASVTKVSTSILALMRLQDEGKFRLDMTLGEFFPKWKNSNKGKLKMIDILTHQSGLKAWIPFWMTARDSTRESGWKPRTFSNEQSRRYPIAIADHLFLHRRYRRELMRQIEESPVNPKQGYVYSDLSYYLYPQIVEKITGEKWEDYLKNTFYRPMGATTLTYNPRELYALDRIVPTEYDSLFRKELIHGRVHDEGATLMGGISGHAGLFGDANDLAKLYQMYLNGGIYGNQRFISEKTIKQWSSYPFPVEINSRRGIGFDKPDRNKPGLSGPPSASAESFGHSGFTGTFVWVEPKEKMLYIFLANRVYPTRNNSKISKLNTRTQFGEMIYEAIRKSNVPGF
ncbi:glycoside hydrolase family 3 N-terminal domain-containing protein [Siphonobacter sp. SORGH_AS_1065]|uniref:glycoside hydrolase family 3 N-terminal domain-containing protein n=1 Tax=Siphonobacter sp. SORGH_AS_1065 TaxID=3041795 RepID=UPI00278A8564|nr:glycoside hydrolase family 3 N-terminal domain-containing protein [Siphonobacter sp. SORGH_AS_1065]MDQ1086115.1 beta-N-acetylhexosaminidase [Siphonobacter sp. SORGH_AS_1065]